jgi:CHASE1-domain containing sensor protein
MPPTKANNWGKADKQYLTDLVSAGDVNISDISHPYIKSVRFEFFKHRSSKNFRRNFRDFAATLDLETEYTGVR